MNKIIPLISLAFIFIAVFLSLDLAIPVRLFVSKFINKYITVEDNLIPNTVLSKHELAKFKGKDNGKVYLAIIGSVFDVSKGRKHYGPGGGYEFFSGIDGSKAFVTGKFDAEGLVDDISDLSNSDILSLNNWKSFYEKSYSFVGIVQGSFYDDQGKELEMMSLYRQKLTAALNEQNIIENERQLFPPCNSEWSQQSGARVWCSNLSGGVERSWEGVPRMYFTAGSSKPRCACVRQTGPPSHDLESKHHKNNGDLDNPHLNVYPGCDISSRSCRISDD